jgi:hypothetical protein
MYGISMLQEVYSLWEKGKVNKIEEFAVSFKSKDRNKPLIFNGISSLRKYLGKAVFSLEEIAYLHSLQKKSGKLLFNEKFINFLSALVFDLKIETPLEGELFFSGEPVMKVSGNEVVLLFFKKLLEHYLPRQIYLTTEVEKIVSTISPAYVITENTFCPYKEELLLDTRSGYLAGACATEDLTSAVNFNIPICFMDKKAKITFLNVNDKNFTKNLSEVSGEEKIFLKGKITKEFIEEFPYYGPKLKGVLLDLSNFNEKAIQVVFHYYRNLEVLSSDFRIFRYFHNGLYFADILSNYEEIEKKKTIFGKYVSSLKRKELLHDICFFEEETTFSIRARVMQNMRLLPCKYRSLEKESFYPVRILRKFSHNTEESLSNTRFA